MGVISAVSLRDFKSFRRARLEIRPLTVLVGPNASGKSNLRDALRLLHGIGRGYSLADTIGEKWGQAGQREWSGIRGGVRDLIYRGTPGGNGSSASCELRAEVAFPERAAAESDLQYTLSVSVSNDVPTISHERLDRVLEQDGTWARLDPVFRDERGERTVSGAGRIPGAYPGQGYYWKYASFDEGTPLLIQIPKEDRIRARVRDAALAVQRQFAAMRFLDVAPDAARRPSVPGQTVLGDRGENLASVLQKIMEDDQSRIAVLDWLREFTPAEFQDLDFEKDATGRLTLLLVDQRGRKFLADSASDGTLRFLAILAAVFGPSPADLYFFEEIENGVHPSRAHLLVDLIGQQARARGIKVIVSTHAPALLSAMPPADLAQAVYCYLDLGEGGQETKLITFHEIPHLEDRLAEVRVDALFADGWIETALSLATDPTHP